LILARYAEVGLKSRGVRRYFERILVNNIMTALAKNDIEALVNAEHGRLFIETGEIDRAIAIISRVFGIASLSPVLRAESNLPDMMRVAAEYSRTLLHPGDSFAVRPRREGDHPFTSVDVGREVGSAIWQANEDKKVRVDLSHPDVEIFVEVRKNRTYIFSQYVPGPGGLPMGSQGRVVARVDNEEDALAAWLVMKRGCRVIVLSEHEAASILQPWDPYLAVEKGKGIREMIREHHAHAAVFGCRMEDFEGLKKINLEVPAFFPLIGFTDDEVEKRLETIKKIE